MPDQDGYPTDDELKRIDEWPEGGVEGEAHAHWNALFDFVRSVWWGADWRWHELEGPPRWLRGLSRRRRFAKHRWLEVSTGGWSGNEELISHLQRKVIVWDQTWVNHRCGGYYIFAVPRSASGDDD